MNIELFTGLDWYRVETAVNDFITLPRVAVKDIQFSTAKAYEYNVEYSVMVVYEDLADADAEVE